MQALALKYRPRNFGELIGQDAVSKSLTHALEGGRISHAYLFSGLRGSGKTSSARIFSKALVCEHGPSAHPCETCAHCQMANESRHMDIIEMDAASHRKIDDIRELIEQTKYAPAAARFKIFIIDEVHMLTKEAFNALLKTLEEPPSYVKFILATTDPLKLPATVLSRTQHFRFKQISRTNVIKHLEFILSKEGVSYEREALEILARSGSGSLRDTLTLLDQAIIYGTGNVTQNTAASMLGLLDPARVEEILDIVSTQDKNRLKTLIAEIEIYEPEMIIDELIASLKDKFLTNDPRFSLLIYERFFRILAQAKSMLGVSSDNGFVLSLMLFMMIEAQNLKSIDEAISQLESQKKEANLSAVLNRQNDNLAQNFTQPSPNLTTQNLAKSQQNNAINANFNKQDELQNSPYEQFLAKIYDRSHELGECFKRSVSFISFQDSTLTLSTPASGADRERLVVDFKVINQLAKSVFGQNTKIDAQKRETAQILASQTQNTQESAVQTTIKPEEQNIQILAQTEQDTQNFTHLSQANLPETKPTPPQPKQKDTMSFLDEELARMNLAPTPNNNENLEPNLNTQESTKETKKEELETKNLIEPINFNSQRSPQEQEKVRQEGILREANRLFGQPHVIKQ